MKTLNCVFRKKSSSSSTPSSSSLVAYCLLLACVCLTSGCADKPCREARRPELDRTGDPENLASQQPLPRTPGRVWISRPDGSLQCQNGSGKSVSESARDLAGVVVYRRETRLDGLMRVQLCGTPTGRLHVFEIDERRLKEAERRGFTLYQSNQEGAGEATK